MHAEAFGFVSRTMAGRRFGSVVEIGGRNINGTVRRLIDADSYVSVDLFDGPGVDVVADALQWQPDEPADLVVCCEVLEHAPKPSQLVMRLVSFAKPGGMVLITCAGPGRAPHSTHDGGAVRDGEYYGNVNPDDLTGWLRRGCTDVEVVYDERPHDVYATAVKREDL